MTTITWLLGLVLYLLAGLMLVKLIQLYDKKEGIEEKEEFYLCIALWPIILSMFILDWLFRWGAKK